jgi:hypothetical protein
LFLTVSCPIVLLFAVVEGAVDENREPARQKAILFYQQEIKEFRLDFLNKISRFLLYLSSIKVKDTYSAIEMSYFINGLFI